MRGVKADGEQMLVPLLSLRLFVEMMQFDGGAAEVCLRLPETLRSGKGFGKAPPQRTKALSPVTARPTMRVFISRVPS